MPDNWSFVALAYLIGAAALGGYWRRLVRIEKSLETRPTPRRRPR